jgi:hypothetical protein
MSWIKGFAGVISLIGVTTSIVLIPTLFSITTEPTTRLLIVFFAIMAWTILLILMIGLNQRRINKLRNKVIKILEK